MYDFSDTDGSTDSNQNDSDSDTRQVDTLINEVAPDPDHTRRFLAESRRVTEGKLTSLLQALKTDRADEIKGVYERYRETVDYQRAIGDEADRANGDEYGYTGHYEASDDFKPVDGKVLLPLFSWNQVRKNAAADKASDLPGNLPCYKAVYPEPTTDDLTVWFKQEVSPGSSDSHIYGTTETVDMWGNFKDNTPPVSVADYKAVMSDDDSTPESDDSDEDIIPVCGGETSSGDACRTPVANHGDTCQHHDEAIISDSDRWVTKESREFVTDVEMSEDTDEDTADESEDTTDESDEVTPDSIPSDDKEFFNNLLAKADSLSEAVEAYKMLS